MSRQVAYLRRSACGLAVVFALALSSTVAPPVSRGSARAAADVGRAAFHPVVACRLIDTRLTHRVTAGTAIDVDVVGRCGVPTSAVAAAVVITIVDPSGSGFATASGSGTPRPLASNVNFDIGETRANTAIVAIGANGAFSVFVSMNAHVVVDVTGAFVTEPLGTAAAGRLVTLPSTRVLDTRTGSGPVPAGDSVAVALPPTVPADATALSVTITATDTLGAGFFTVAPTGTSRPLASMLNIDGVGETRAAGGLVAVSALGLTVFSSGGGHLIVDVTGYFTGPSAPALSSGLFHAIDPTRLLDTRGIRQPIGASDLTFAAQAAGIGFGAVAATWTVANSTAAGYVSAFPAGMPRPPTSTVNADKAGQTVANFGVVAASSVGLQAHANVTTDLVVDAVGWFTGSPLIPGTVVVAAVGDAVCPPGSPVTTSKCRERTVSDLVVDDPMITVFLALGDLQYDSGALSSFQSAYEASFGRVKAITKPVPGNHEYATPGASGYFDYFGPLAGDPTKGYYSFDIGTTWHAVALNSECAVVACAAGSTQARWLATDLAATTRPCVLAFWHRPRFSSGLHGSDASFAPFWQILQQHHVEIVLSGHDHDYERFDPMRDDGRVDPSGIRSFVVGTGGRDTRPFETVQAGSALRITEQFGVLKLALQPTGYAWSFVNESDNVLDEGAGGCS